MQRYLLSAGYFFSFIYGSRQQNGFKAVAETKFDYGKGRCEIVQSVIAIWNPWSFRVWYLPRDYSWISMLCNGCVRAHGRYAVSSLLTITLAGAHAPLAGTHSAALLIGGLLFIVLIEDGRLFASFWETSLKFSEARGYKNILLEHAGAAGGVFAMVLDSARGAECAAGSWDEGDTCSAASQPAGPLGRCRARVRGFLPRFTYCFYWTISQMHRCSSAREHF